VSTSLARDEDPALPLRGGGVRVATPRAAVLEVVRELRPAAGTGTVIRAPRTVEAEFRDTLSAPFSVPGFVLVEAEVTWWGWCAFRQGG
jgi:hypothetical protein